MKIFRNVLAGFFSVLFVMSCRPTPNHLHGQVNSTESGSHVVEGSDEVSGNYDTLSPVQPNGQDTTGEQTPRMNNTHQ